MAKKILISVGDILKEEYLDPMGISAYRLAHEIGVSTSLMSQIIRGTTGISADVAWRLGQFFNTSAQYWLNMQATCDSRKIESKYAAHKPKISTYRQFVKIPKPENMKGKIWMADDFDAPLEDFKEYM